MLISTEIASAAKHVGEEKAIELYAKAGFDAWDFSMFSMATYNWETKTFSSTNHPLSGNDYLAFARKLKKVGEDNGIHCNQSHAPFPSLPSIYDHLKRAIECTAEAGGKICIIHPNNDSTPEENAEMYASLLEFSKGYNIKIATENMFNWSRELDYALPAACSDPESFHAHLDAVNDPNFVACLDLGHAEMKGNNTCAVDMIRGLGKKLQALHIHDNDCWHDDHQIPFSMQIDFDAIVKALKEIGYAGYFTLEADRYLSGFTPDTIFEGCKNLAASARKLSDMFENA